jgi:hypothetical protein
MVLVLVDSGWIVEVVAKIDVEVAVSVITDTENTVDTLPVCSVLVDVVLGDSVLHDMRQVGDEQEKIKHTIQR